MNAVVMRKCAEHLGQDLLCKFKFVEDDVTTIDQHIDRAIKLKQLGATIDLQQLRETIGGNYIKSDLDEAWQPEGE